MEGLEVDVVGEGVAGVDGVGAAAAGRFGEEGVREGGIAEGVGAEGLEVVHVGPGAGLDLVVCHGRC